jgi:PKD repeat protein
VSTRKRGESEPAIASSKKENRDNTITIQNAITLCKKEKAYNVSITVSDDDNITFTKIQPITIYPQNRTITNLRTNWNIISISNTQSINRTEIIVRYNGTDFNWSQATTSDNPVGEPIILGFIYGWDRTNQIYLLSDVLDPVYGYWMYAYYNCTLLRPDV